MMIIDRYIMTRHALGMVPVLLLLLALFSFVALAEEMEQVGNGSFSQLDAFLVVLFTAPRRIVDLLPVTALMGGLMGLGAMANHQELIAARAAGMSKARMARPVLLTAVLTAILVVLLQSFIVPASEREAAGLRSRALESTSVETVGEFEFWTRSGRSIVHVENVRFNRVLAGVEIYDTDENGALVQLIEAEEATILGPDNWVLEDVQRTTLDGMGASEEAIDRLPWEGLLSEEQANILILPVEALSLHDLVRYIQHLRRNGLDTHYFRVIFWQQFSIALAVIAMGLLSLPLLVGSTRSISASQRIVTGGMIGIGFYLMQQVTGHLAGLFGLLPWLTIMAPVLLLLLVAVLAQYARPPARKKSSIIRQATGD
jgi:lipopolysaccharide export system permease protein